MDIKGLMSQMQNQFQVVQKKLETFEVTGESGGTEGIIVKMDGKFVVKDIKINFLPKEKEDLEILEDLVKKAINEAHQKIETEVKKLTGGLR